MDRKKIAGQPVLRPVAIRLLRAIGDRDVTIRHGWTGDRIRINAFRHRGYWFHGRRRESREMRLAAELLSDEGTIVDMGAHIGFLSLYYHWLAPNAEVVAVEPSPANLRYLRQNSAERSITVVPVAVGSGPGTATLHVDDLTGQNSSLVSDFNVLARNAESSRVAAKTQEVQVPIRSIDSILETATSVGFMKIDVEGFELEAVSGSGSTFARHRPALQVEVQRNSPEVVRLLESYGYLLFSSTSREALLVTDSPKVVFGVHAENPHLAAFKRIAQGEGYAQLTD